MITEFNISVQHPDGLHEANEEVNEVISRIISATMVVNPPGEWELVREENEEPIHQGGLHVNRPYAVAQTFRFTAHDNVPVGGKTHGS